MPVVFQSIEDTAQNAGCVLLSGLSKAAILHALQALLCYGYWCDSDGEGLSESEWDTVDAAINAATWQLMDDNQCKSGGNVIGSILAVATTTAPTGTLLCDGSVYNRVDYPDLYDALHSQFIIDADTFKVPDLQGRVIIGVDTTYTMNSYGGEVEHTLTVAEMPSHTHLTSHRVLSEREVKNRDYPGTGSDMRVATESTNSAGGDTAHNNMQPYRALSYVIVSE